MRTRRKARETALQALYQSDTTNDWSLESRELFENVFCADKAISQANPQNFQFFRALVAGVCQSLATIDKGIAASSTHWNLARMACVDRNIIRLAAYEIVFLDDIPVNASINEAIEIAKRFGSDDSPTFVNGVLDRFATLVRESPEIFQITDARKLAANG